MNNQMLIAIVVIYLQLVKFRRLNLETAIVVVLEPYFLDELRLGTGNVNKKYANSIGKSNI